MLIKMPVKDSKKASKDNSIERVTGDESDIPVSILSNKFADVCFDKGLAGAIALRLWNSSDAAGHWSSAEAVAEVAITDKEDKPALYVELADANDGDSVVQLVVKDWTINDRMLDILVQTCGHLVKLHTLRLWNAGVTPRTLPLLMTFAETYPALRTIHLDINPLADESFHHLLTARLKLKHASFRFCDVTDRGVQLLGDALGTCYESNTELLTLNLDGNRITDDGAKRLAQSLRTNRTLLMLSLAGNAISDKGAKAFADVLMPSFLTEDELGYRRQLLCEKFDAEAKRDVEAIPSSHVSKTMSQKSSPTMSENGRVKRKDSAAKEPEVNEATELVSPVEEPLSGPAQLLLTGLSKDDKTKRVKLPANFTLLSLNLSRNKITSLGAKSLLDAATYQRATPPELRFGGRGIVRLELEGNDVAGESYARLKELLEETKIDRVASPSPS